MSKIIPVIQVNSKIFVGNGKNCFLVFEERVLSYFSRFLWWEIQWVFVSNKFKINGLFLLRTFLIERNCMYSPQDLCIHIYFDCMVYSDPRFLIPYNNRHNHKTKNNLIFLSEARGRFFWSYVIMQGISNKFIEIHFCVGCMVRPCLHL